MRISDWSSDVCSSDLHGCLGRGGAERLTKLEEHVIKTRGSVKALIRQGVLTRVESTDYRRRARQAPAPAHRRGTQGPPQHRRQVPAGLAGDIADRLRGRRHRSEEHTSELQSLMRISSALLCMKKKK